MPNNNIFREAKQLLATKPVEEMTQEEVTTVKAATIPLDILPEFDDLTILEGLEELAKIFEEKHEGINNTAKSTPKAKVGASEKD